LPKPHSDNWQVCRVPQSWASVGSIYVEKLWRTEEQWGSRRAFSFLLSSAGTQCIGSNIRAVTYH
jgi:hypothetical protein